MGEMLEAGAARYAELKNLIVWAKDNGGMGSFYRSRHELIFAFKNGAAPHINSFELGQHGRYRTNVWEYRGVNTLKAGRLDELMLHPTVKPVALIADAIKDVSRRGGVILDLFGGSGSTLIAAHKTGRRARLCELDPVYCDRILSPLGDFRQRRRRTHRVRTGKPARDLRGGTPCPGWSRRNRRIGARWGSAAGARREELCLGQRPAPGREDWTKAAAAPATASRRLRRGSLGG